MCLETSDQHRELVARLKSVIYPWRRLTIAVDGVDHSGKSTMARYLSWQLGMPVIETDLFLAESKDGLPTYRWEMLAQVVSSRHQLDRPVIVEGIFVRSILEKLGTSPDFSIYVECIGHQGSVNWQNAFSIYQAKYKPRESAAFVFAHDGQ
jgi:uridine kinase